MGPEPRYESHQEDILAVIDLAEERGIDLSRMATVDAPRVIDQLLAEIHWSTADPSILRLAWQKDENLPFTSAEMQAM